MTTTLREDCDKIVAAAIARVQPDEAVRRALADRSFSGRVVLIAAGKAAWRMARAAVETLGERIDGGTVITKYGHIPAPIPGLECCEAGHPLPDDNSFAATERAIARVKDLTERDTVLLLLSGGGSALLEKPLVAGEELRSVTEQLLRSGADIREMNTVRKRLSAVKGGRFAALCAPARVLAVVLSDIIGDPLDMIASGPACPDSATAADARAVVRKYGLALSEEAERLLDIETPKKLDNVESVVTGSVRELCAAAGDACRALGYETVFLTDRLDCEAREAGRFLGAILRAHAGSGRKLAFLAGGETVVHVAGHGMGGRNQELALAAAELLDGVPGCALLSAGSDGTDGPTDAAGGYVDGDTAAALRAAGCDLSAALRDNDAYHALQKANGLIVTGPTGTNVNDVTVGLLRG